MKSSSDQPLQNIYNNIIYKYVFIIYKYIDYIIYIIILL